MKTYTVKQISEMLDTNEETVRRWIRKGKLVSNQTSRKDGNVVTKEELEKFLSTMPKYSSKVDLNKGLFNISLKSVSSPIVKKYDEIDLPNDKLVSFLISDITRIRESIKEREELIDHTKEEIKDLKTQLNKYEKILKSKR